MGKVGRTARLLPTPEGSICPPSSSGTMPHKHHVPMATSTRAWARRTRALLQPSTSQDHFPVSLVPVEPGTVGEWKKPSAPTAAGRDALPGSGLSANEVSVLPLALLGSWSPLGARASRSRSSQELAGSWEQCWLMLPQERRLCRLSASSAPGRIHPRGCGEQKAPQHRHRAPVPAGKRSSSMKSAGENRAGIP